MKKITSIMGMLVFAICMISLISCATTQQVDSEYQKAAIRANDIADCKNLMGHHVWYHAAYMNDVELEKCWVTTPEYTETAVWAQNANYWIGIDSIKAYYGPTTPREQTKSGFQFHATTTGVVEIAEDRMTAKGVWYTPGAIGTANNIQGMWERYGIDFVRENGVWKIWHLHVYTDFSFSMKSGSGGGQGAGGFGGGGQGAAPGGMMGGGQGAPEGMMGGGQGAPEGMMGGGQGAPEGMMGGGQGGMMGGGQGGMMGGGQGAPEGMMGGGQGAPEGMMGGRQGGASEEQAERFGMESGGGTGRPMAQSQATADPGYKELSADSYADLIPRPPQPYTTFSETWSYGDPDEVKMFSGAYREWSEIKASK